jgi:hypothetical protein
MLSAPATPTVSIIGSTNLTPTNPTVQLTSSPALNYSWTTGAATRSIIVNSQGSYRVTVRNSNGCESVSPPVNVSANGCTPPPVPVISGPNVLTSGQTLTLTSTVAAGYLWSNGATTRSINVSSPGSYWVRVYSAGNCYSSSLPFNVIMVAARHQKPAAEIMTAAGPEIFPNPSNGEFFVRIHSAQPDRAHLRIYGMTGRLVHRSDKELLEGENVFGAPGILPRGIYLVNIVTGTESKTLKLVVE